MKSTWYCTDCETPIDEDEVEEHEEQGHYVRGKLRPDRLLGNDPWQVSDEAQAPTDTDTDTDDS
jgi:hypothetical protein